MPDAPSDNAPPWNPALEEPLRLDLDPRQREAYARQRRWLQDTRQRRGLGRMEVARRMGYQKPERGAAKIARWERGDEVPRGDRVPVLARALGVDEALVRDIGAGWRAERSQRAHNERVLALAACGAIDFDARLLAHHGPQLDRQAEGLLADPWLAGARVCGARLSFAYIGGRTLTLGDLLRLWDDETMMFVCDACGERGRAISVGGSPLSGAHSARGHCLPCGRVTSGRLPEGLRVLSVARRASALPSPTADEPAVNPWSVGQLLATHLGAPTPDVRVTDEAGVTVAVYQHSPAQLSDAQGRPLARFADPGAWGPAADAGSAEWCAEWGPPRVQGRPVIGSLTPPRFGAWMGEALKVSDPAGRAWSARPGVLTDPAGRPALRLEGALPPAVLRCLVAWRAAG